MGVDTSYDPIFTGYGAPVITHQPYGVSTPTTELISAYDPIIFECTWAGDSNDTISNQVMYAEVYYGASNTLLGTMRKTSIDLSGTTTYRFNISDMLKTVLSPEFYNYISTDQINSSAALEALCSQFYVDFYVKYLDNLQVEREDTTLTSSTYYVCNTILDHTQQYRIIEGGTSDYVLDSDTSKFLTDAPQNKQIAANEDEQLMFYYTGSSDLTLRFQKYDLGGNALTAGFKTQVPIVNKYGTITISDNGAGTMLQDFADNSKIDIWITETTGGAQVSEKRTYTMNHKCTEGYRLWWMNHYGAIDKYTFDAHTNTTYKLTERNTFEKPLEVGLDAFTTADQRTMLASKQTTVLKNNGATIYNCTSTFQASDMVFFEDLFKSQDVRFQPDTSSTNVFPIILTSMEQVLTDTDGLIQVNIEFVISKKDKSHIG